MHSYFNVTSLDLLVFHIFSFSYSTSRRCSSTRSWRRSWARRNWRKRTCSWVKRRSGRRRSEIWSAITLMACFMRLTAGVWRGGWFAAHCGGDGSEAACGGVGAAGGAAARTDHALHGEVRGVPGYALEEQRSLSVVQVGNGKGTVWRRESG